MTAIGAAPPSVHSAGIGRICPTADLQLVPKPDGSAAPKPDFDRRARKSRARRSAAHLRLHALAIGIEIVDKRSERLGRCGLPRQELKADNDGQTTEEARPDVGKSAGFRARRGLLAASAASRARYARYTVAEDSGRSDPGPNRRECEECQVKRPGSRTSTGGYRHHDH